MTVPYKPPRWMVLHHYLWRRTYWPYKGYFLLGGSGIPRFTFRSLIDKRERVRLRKMHQALSTKQVSPEAEESQAKWDRIHSFERAVMPIDLGVGLHSEVPLMPDEDRQELKARTEMIYTQKPVTKKESGWSGQKDNRYHGPVVLDPLLVLPFDELVTLKVEDMLFVFNGWCERLVIERHSDSLGSLVNRTETLYYYPDPGRQYETYLLNTLFRLKPMAREHFKSEYKSANLPPGVV